jgi:small nuclear ribonucleoprotein (snRNP)-like protein
MASFLNEVTYAIDDHDKRQVSVKFLNGDTLVGRLEYSSENSFKLHVQSGEPYIINSAHVLWVRPSQDS